MRSRPWRPAPAAPAPWARRSPPARPPSAAQITLGTGSALTAPAGGTLLLSGAIGGTGGIYKTVWYTKFDRLQHLHRPDHDQPGQTGRRWLADQSAVTVNSGGTLGGTGSLTSVTVNAGGQSCPGRFAGRLEPQRQLDLASGAAMDYELDTAFDRATMSRCHGPTVLNGQQFSDFNFTPLAVFGPGSYDLIDAGSISGSLGANTSGTIDGYPATLARARQRPGAELSRPNPPRSRCSLRGRRACSATVCGDVQRDEQQRLSINHKKTTRPFWPSRRIRPRRTRHEGQLDRARRAARVPSACLPARGEGEMIRGSLCRRSSTRTEARQVATDYLANVA